MISSILSYCTIDFKFLEVNIKQLSNFSDEIIIPICTHLFSGELENQDLLKKSIDIIKKYSRCKYVLFDWEGQKENISYYHTMSRKIGTDLSKNNWLLFVDADEIASDNFKTWFLSVCDTEQSFWMSCYWYFREPIYRSKTLESCGLLVRKQECDWNCNLRSERQQLFPILKNLIHGDKILILDQNKEPLFHHFSWVRTKEEMLKKVKNWGHSDSKDSLKLAKTIEQTIKHEFLRPFNGTDFIHNYEYDVVDNIFNIPLNEKHIHLFY